MLRPALLVASFLALAASSAAAGDATDGLQPGTPAPTFTLPVINDFVPPVVPTGPLAPKQAKWGPGRWTGEKPDETKKLVIMSFFATYCEPCKKEMPELSRLYDAYKDQGLGVMLVSIDKGDEQRQTIIDLAKEHKVAFPVMHDRYQVVARRYAAERLPYMLMLDPAGTVKVVHVGYTEDLKANLENEVRGHLGLPPLPPPAPAADKADKPEKGDKGDKGKKQPKAEAKPAPSKS
jgi:thiol-disulfide isomerase/thioredoxin